MKRLLQIAVISFFVFYFTADSHAAWAPWGEPFQIIEGQPTRISALVPDSKGGWVALLTAGSAQPYSLLLARVSISNVTGQIEVKWVDTGIKARDWGGTVTPGAAYRASLSTALDNNLLAISTQECESGLTWKLVVRYYNLDLIQQGEAVSFNMPSSSIGFSLAIRLDNPAAIFLIESDLIVHNTKATKFDLSGAVLTGPTEVIHNQECPGGNSLWPTPDGGAFLLLGLGFCMACDDTAPCPTGVCLFPPIFQKLDKNLHFISGTTAPAVPLVDYGMQIKLRADGALMALWDEKTYEMGGMVGVCWLETAKMYMQVTNAAGVFGGTPALIGDTALGNYVCGALALQPGGGFSLVESSDCSQFLFPPYSITYSLYLYDSSGILTEGPITFFEPPPTGNYGHANGDFDKRGHKFVATWQDNANAVARIIREIVNTLEGSDVAYTDPSGVTITFDTVNQGGNTEVNQTQQGPPTPNGFKMGAPPVYYELTTTAIFEGGATVCISYDESRFSGPESKIRLFKNDADGYSDVTTSLDTEANIICGRVDSFSTFMVIEPDYGFPIPRSNMTETGNGSCSIGSGAGGAGDALPFLFLIMVGVCSRVARRNKTVA